MSHHPLLYARPLLADTPPALLRKSFGGPAERASAKSKNRPH